MALNFDASQYGNAYNTGQANEQANNNRLLQLLASLGQTGNQMLDLSQKAEGIRSARDQRTQDNMTLDQLLNPGGNSKNSLSQPVANTPLPEIPQAPIMQQAEGPGLPVEGPQQPGMYGPQLPIEGPRPMNHIENFQNFLKGQQPQSMQPAQPQTSPFGQYGGMKLGQLRRIPEQVQKSMFPQQKPAGKTSIDQLLAEKVSNGELTIEDALKMKQQQMNIISYDPTNKTVTTLGTAPKGSQVIQPKPGGSTVDKYTQAQIAKARAELAENRPMVNSTLSEIGRVKLLNDKSRGGYGGAALQKVESATGLGTDSEEFKNTADVINTMQQSVARVLKSTFGGQLSDSERAYLNEVYGALPKMSQQERKIAMTNVETMLRNKLSASESKLRELSSYAGGEMDVNSGGGGDPLGIR